MKQLISGCSSSGRQLIRILVKHPVKSATRYEIRCHVYGLPITLETLRRRSHSVIHRYGGLTTTVYRFGYEAINFEIQHHDIWDSILPIYALIRNSGPLFHLNNPRARIQFEYPISESVAKFFTRWASLMGSEIEIDAETRDFKFDNPTAGHAVPFGGGKESRLIYGILREQGISPNIHSSLGRDMNFASDIHNAKLTRMFSQGNINRTFSALMTCPKYYYSGTGFGEAILEKPWQDYYDAGSPTVLREFSDLLKELGLDITIKAWISVLPASVAQNILYKRYPDLYARQHSVKINEESEKNLHISLIKYHHGIDYSSHCPQSLFEKLLTRFVAKNIQFPDDHGHRNHRRLFNHEMRGIIFAHKNEPAFSRVCANLPCVWKQNWFDYVHSYIYPDIDSDVLSVFQEYARDANDDPSCARFPF